MMTAAERLKSIRSNHLFSGTKIQQQAFGRILIFFDNGDLENKLPMTAFKPLAAQCPGANPVNSASMLLLSKSRTKENITRKR